MAKKYRFKPGEREILNQFIQSSFQLQVQVIENGKFKTIKRFGRGREFLSKGAQHDLNGRAFEPDMWYEFAKWPVYYDLRQILIDALRKGGTEEMKKAFSQYLENYEKAKKLREAENASTSLPTSEEKSEPE